MKQQKSLLWLISIFILSMILTCCGGDASGNSDSSGDGDKKVVGIAMPTKSSERRVGGGDVSGNIDSSADVETKVIGIGTTTRSYERCVEDSNNMVKQLAD